jgi:collagenase-like PrtC family protease
MRLCAPTNFDDGLIEPLAKAGVYEVYGKLTADAVGGGRTSHVLPAVSRARLAEHVAAVRRAGIRFDYLLNAASMAAVETTGAGYRRIRRLLDLVAGLPVDSITVTNPLLLQVCKRHYPKLEVKVSAFANVATPLQAKYWADLGADVITASPVLLNRELAVLREMCASVPAGIQVIANNNCLQSCPFYQAHSTLVSHTSQEGHWSRGYMIDYCILNCRTVRLADPVSYVRGDWIRPEDVQTYEALGARYLKLVNRSNPTAVIVQRVNAYAARRFEGNLVELFEHGRDFQGARKAGVKDRLRMAGTFVRPRLANPLRLMELTKTVLPAEAVVRLDNRKLDGFLDFFRGNSCLTRSCAACGYCEKVAARAMQINGETVAEFRSRYRDALNKMVDGYYFRWV